MELHGIVFGKPPTEGDLREYDVLFRALAERQHADRAR